MSKSIQETVEGKEKKQVIIRRFQKCLGILGKQGQWERTWVMQEKSQDCLPCRNKILHYIEKSYFLFPVVHETGHGLSKVWGMQTREGSPGKSFLTSLFIYPHYPGAPIEIPQLRQPTKAEASAEGNRFPSGGRDNGSVNTEERN